jgi:hypothetical protein
LEGQNAVHDCLHSLVNRDKEQSGGQALGLRIAALVVKEGEAEKGHEYGLEYSNPAVPRVSIYTELIPPKQPLQLAFQTW